jgi:hypothetical protein
VPVFDISMSEGGEQTARTVASLAMFYAFWYGLASWCQAS